LKSARIFPMRAQKLKNPVVVIFCHSRAELVETAIRSFVNAQDSENWTLVIVQQLGHSEVDSVLQKYSSEIDYLHTFLPVSNHYLANINHSRLLGWEFSFTNLKANFVIGIEEDTSIARDLLVFSKFVFEKYGDHPKFRGINYISFLGLDSKLLHTYTVRRFGLSGQCGGLPARTWKKFNLAHLRALGSKEEWASHIEPIMKSGFTVFSNQSRALDQGWGGTSNPKSVPADEYYIRQQSSWVGEHSCEELFSRLDGQEDIWRKDAILYSAWHNFYFSFRANRALQICYKVLRKLGFPNLKSLILGGD
jgi:hypothetical protein